jgi:glycylpeptide N-tetradecanoyltransferase
MAEEENHEETRSAEKVTEVEDEAEVEANAQPGNDVPTASAGEVTAAPKKKKRSAKKKIKDALGGKKEENLNDTSKLSSDAVQALLKANPSLEQQVSGMSKENAEDLLRKLSISDLLTGMVGSPFSRHSQP